jgi:hypothetical protein
LILFKEAENGLYGREVAGKFSRLAEIRRAFFPIYVQNRLSGMTTFRKGYLDEIPFSPS